MNISIHFQILRIVLIYKIKKPHLTRLLQVLGRYIEITNFFSSQYCIILHDYTKQKCGSARMRFQYIDDVKRQGIPIL